MNEWSPGVSYSRPGTPNPSGRSFRSQVEDSDKGTKPLIVSMRSVSDNKSKAYQQHSLEDMSKSSLSITGKSKKGPANGGSDPRFKRVVVPGQQSHVCVGTEGKPASKRHSSALPDKRDYKCAFPPRTTTTTTTAATAAAAVAMTTNATTTTMPTSEPKPWDPLPESKDPVKTLEGYVGESEVCDNLMQMDATEAEQPQDHLKEVEKLAFSHDILAKSVLKDSLSNCTVNTMNTSLLSDDLFEKELSLLPDSNRVKKVQHWIQDQKTPKPEKKQSVITVIGQTKGQQETLSPAQQEIENKRKLVKELDKYATCRKIIDAERGKEISNLLAKITSLPPATVKHSKDSKCDVADATIKITASCNGGGDAIDKNTEKIEKSSAGRERNAGTDTVSTVTKKRSSSKKKTKKVHGANGDCLIKGKIQNFLNRAQYQWMFYVVFLITGILCWITFASLHNGSYIYLDYFSKKPKTITWYEKFCMWLWEFFRPAANYKRSGGSWRSY